MLPRTVELDNTSWKCLEEIFARRFEDVLKTSWRGFQNVLKTSWRCLAEVFARCLEDVLKTSWRCLEDILKMSWRLLEDIFVRRLEDVWPRWIYWSWSRRPQDVFWRRMSKANIFVLIKTSWIRLLQMKTKDVFKTSSVRLHQDECLLGWYI